MTLSYTLSSSTGNIISPDTRVLHISHFNPPRNRFSFFSSETSLFKRETFPFKPQQQQPPKSFLPILRLDSSKPAHPFASLSSYAEAGGEEEEERRDSNRETARNAFAALSVPLCMKTLGMGLDLKTKFLSYVTLLFGFYMAWNIGANDVANAMGTSVGSGALTIRQAVLTAAVLEFSGALLMGTHVTSTMQNGILVANVFQGKDTLLFAGLLSSLAAAGTWLQ
ncbi:PHOSPHATE TRANSPORTER, partial [Salix koriyanagi]